MARLASGGGGSEEHGTLNVVLFGGVGAGNIGNEESANVAAAFLTENEPGVRIRVATPFFDHASSGTFDVIPTQQGIAAIRTDHSRPRKLIDVIVSESRAAWQAVRVLEGTDLLMVPGTGIADDFVESAWGMPASLFLWALLARTARCPFVMTSIGAGPVDSRLGRWFIRGASRLATRITARDAESAAFLSDLRGKDVDTTCDIVLGRDEQTWEDAQELVTRVVGIGVMGYYGWSPVPNGAIHDRYVKTMIEVCDRLIRDGFRIRILLGQPVDARTAEEVVSGLDRETASAVTTTLTKDFSEMLREVRQTDLVIASRFHTVVAALLADRPIVSIGYHRKNGLLLDEFGFPGFDKHVELADSEWIMERVHLALGCRATRTMSESADIIDNCRARTREELRIALRLARSRRQRRVRPRRRWIWGRTK